MQKSSFKIKKYYKSILTVFSVAMGLLVAQPALAGILADLTTGTIQKGFALLANFVLQLISWILWVSGGIMNVVFKETVLEMSDTINNITVINSAWVVIRDFANMFFIFVLVYIAVRTILGLSSHSVRQMLTRLIIAAILINFSLFFTKIIIDASNIVATEFYSSITVGSDNLGNLSAFDSVDKGLSAAFMQGLGLQTLFDSTGSIGKQLANVSHTGVVMLGGSVLMLIAAWSFFAAAFLLIVRFVMFIFLMITSPVAFLMGAVPGLENISRRWWSALYSNAIFAPVYMALTWFVLFMINSDAWTSMVKKASFVELLKSDNTVAFDAVAATFFNYGVVIVFMVASLIIAKSVGMQFASQAEGAARKVRGFVARNSAGWAGVGARKLGEKAEKLRGKERTGIGKTLNLVGVAGTQMRKGGAALEEQKFGTKSSRKDIKDSRSKRKSELGGRLRVYGAHEDIEAATKPGATAADIDKAIKSLESLSQAEFRKVGIKTLSHENIASRLSRKLDSIERDSEMSDSNKETFMKAYSKPLEDAVARERATPGSGSADIATYLKGRGGDAVAKLDPAMLTSDEVIPHLEPAMLRAMIRTLDISQGPIVGAKVRASGNPRAIAYITRTPGQDFYS